MGSIRLSRILRKETSFTVQGILDAVGAPLAVCGSDGELLLGTDPGMNSGENGVPVILEGRVLGHVFGGGAARPVASLLEHLAEREVEKRALARETLEKYKEIHLLYRMSERISTRLDLEEVAGAVLDEARQTIQATGGSVMLLKEETGNLEIAAGVGQEQPDKMTLGPGLGIAGSVFVSGRAEIVNNAPCDPRFLPGSQKIESLMCAPLRSKARVFGVMNLSSREAVEYTAAELKLLNALASQAASAIENAILHEKRIRQERIRSNLERYVASQIVDVILDAPEEISLASENRHIAVLFSDIRNFSGTCESLAAEDVVGYLNTYFTAMVEEIFRSRGTVNKFVGDMIVALFGAPVPMEKAETAAIRAAVRMQKRLQSLDDAWIRDHFHTGVGVSAGRVVVGNIGSPRHMDYTAIGDEVNVASRLQAEAKGGQILVSRTVYEAGRDVFSFRPMGPIRVKGKQKPVETYEVLYGGKTGT